MSPHHLQLELCEPLPAEIDAGTPLELTVKASCPFGCDLTGCPATIFEADRIISTTAVAQQEEGGYEVAFVGIEAPKDVGEHTWNIVIGDAEQAVHDEACLTVVFTTKPHTSSLAVWDVPSPVVRDSSFTAKVGLKCSASCQLAGATIEIHDESGQQVGNGTIGNATWEGTENLYWVALQLRAPRTDNVFAWTARFSGEHGHLPHTAASGSFSFRTAPPPDSRVTIDVVAKDTGVGLEDVEIRLGPYEAFTDASGVAVVEVPAGAYELSIRKDGFKLEPRPVIVDGSLGIKVEAETTLTKAELEERLTRFEDYPWG
jgi:hypothetical protein